MRYLIGCLALTSIISLSSAQQTGNDKLAPKAAKTQPKSNNIQPLSKRLRSPRENDRPLSDKLRSPRETLKTLYFSLITYDTFPDMIEDAIACLDLDIRTTSTEEAAFLALQLEYVLQAVGLPLHAVPDASDRDSATLIDSDGIRISMFRGDDCCWRVDSETLKRIPAMHVLARERSRKLELEAKNLVEHYTDPRSTMRRFMVDSFYGDFYAASRALDLSSRSDEDRQGIGPALAQKLAFVMQRRAYFFNQEIPNRPDSPPYTWHADRNGRIMLERIKQPDGREAWQFNRKTVTNIEKMYDAVKSTPPDDRYVRLALLVAEPQPGASVRHKRPEEVPPQLSSPRALLRGFFKTMDVADANEAKLLQVLEYLDLQSLPLEDRGPLGGKLAGKLEAVLRKAKVDLAAVPDDWNAPTQVLGEGQGFRVELTRGRDGCWRFSAPTIARISEMFDKLAARDKSDREDTSQLLSARASMMHFFWAVGRHDYVEAARCLDLSDIRMGARDELGPLLACKLKHILDRLGRVYVQEISDEPDGPRYVVQRCDEGRIVLHRRSDEDGRAQWLFTPETVERIGPMFRHLREQEIDESNGDEHHTRLAVVFRRVPGVWLRLRLPGWAQIEIGWLDLYQWVGLAIAGLASWAVAYISLRQFNRVVSWGLHKSGSALSTEFVSAKLRPLTCLAALWLFFGLLQALDLPLGFANAVLPLKKFLLAGAIAWLLLRLMDLGMGMYTNSELLKPLRSLSDLVVPVSMRLAKSSVLVIFAAYVIYQIGQGALLTRFLTALGVAGLAASLAAQDAMKSFFGTLLLIGERAFKIGDRIVVAGQEGVVEQVGFRSTLLRTAEDSLLTIPNATIAAAAIDNMGARQQRRFKATFVLGHDAPLERVMEVRDRLLAWISQQQSVSPQRLEVCIGRVSEHGVELQVSLYLTTADSVEEARVKEGIYYNLLRLTDELGVPRAPLHRLGSSQALMTGERRRRSA